MNQSVELCQRAVRLGLRLEPRGDMLAVIPAKRCPPDFAAELRQHKGELLDFLKGQAAVARQILAGEFDGLLDNSVRGSLEIGLRSSIHPVCQRALERLHRQTQGQSKNEP